MSDTPEMLNHPRTDEQRIRALHYFANPDDAIEAVFQLERELAEVKAEVAKLKEEREGNTRQFRRLQYRLAQAEADCEFYLDDATRYTRHLKGCWMDQDLGLRYDEYAAKMRGEDDAWWDKDGPKIERTIGIRTPMKDRQWTRPEGSDTPHMPYGDAIDQGIEGALRYWRERALKAEDDAFTMAAGQCCVKDGGLMADDHGQSYCDMQRKRDELRGKLRVMADIMNTALDVMKTVEGDGSDEDEALMHIRAKMASAIDSVRRSDKAAIDAAKEKP